MIQKLHELVFQYVYITMCKTPPFFTLTLPKKLLFQFRKQNKQKPHMSLSTCRRKRKVLYELRAKLKLKKYCVFSRAK